MRLFSFCSWHLIDDRYRHCKQAAKDKKTVAVKKAKEHKAVTSKNAKAAKAKKAKALKPKIKNAAKRKTAKAKRTKRVKKDERQQTSTRIQESVADTLFTKLSPQLGASNSLKLDKVSA